jgi:hypothetical protein
MHPDKLIALIQGGAICTTQKMEDEAFARIYRGYSLGTLDQWVGVPPTPIFDIIFTCLSVNCCNHFQMG